MKRIKILFVLDSLHIGGAQRAFINILRYIDRDMFEVGLALVKKAGELTELLPEDIAVYDMNCQAARYALFRTAGIIRKFSPDIVFSTLSYINELVYLSRKLVRNPPPAVMRCANFESINLGTESFLTRMLMKKAYGSADRVIALTRTMREDLSDSFGIDGGKISVISNMVDSAAVGKDAEEDVEEDLFRHRREVPYVIGAGSLTRQKGFDYLLKGFAQYRKEKEMKLIIIGEGEMRDELVKLASILKIENDLYMPGQKANPYKYIAKCDVFVLSSLWEGFPNVLLEAMACGVPVISTSCQSGPSEIITSGLNGILVPAEDADSIAHALKRVVEDFEYRNELARNAKETVSGYSPDIIIREYEKIFKEVAFSR
ncbi:MAG: glycosyltransferase [Elusimicrobia bacterium]|nr:glycosyltransferase [Elusimicrobiota bacterium]